jgi:hypothetical protein
MLQHVAHGLLHDARERARGRPGGHGHAVGQRNVPGQRDAAPVQRGLDAVPQPCQAVGQRIVVPVHGVHQQAQVEQALLQCPHQRLRRGVARIHQRHGIDELRSHLVVQAARDALALLLQLRAGAHAAPGAPAQGARELPHQQPAQQRGAAGIHDQPALRSVALQAVAEEQQQQIQRQLHQPQGYADQRECGGLEGEHGAAFRTGRAARRSARPARAYAPAACGRCS